MTINDLSNYIIIGIFSLIIITMIVVGGDSEKKESITPIQTSQTQNSQKQQIQKQPISDKIENLTDFENSQFCKDLKCNKEDSWQLNSGGVNHSYHIPLSSDKYNYITVEITIENKRATDFGLMYYDRELSGLSSDDLEIAYKLLNSIDSTRNIDSVKNYIVQNIEKEIFQINKVSPISWGLFNVYAGKIGQQTISIDRLQ